MATSSASQTALLVCDIQPGILSNQFGTDQVAIEAYVDRLNGVLSRARELGLFIVFIRVAFRSGHPEASENNKVFKQIKANNLLVDGTDSAKLHPKLDVQEKDVILTKCRFGSFSTTPLQTILHANEINTIVLTGISTSGVILSTVVDGFDLDYRVIVLSDGVHDANQTAHDVLLKEVFPRRADVMTIKEWSA